MTLPGFLEGGLSMLMTMAHRMARLFRGPGPRLVPHTQLEHAHWDRAARRWIVHGS
jgi:hypothetical protein